jgi:hypothetical protein
MQKLVIGIVSQAKKVVVAETEENQVKAVAPPVDVLMLEVLC